jgi:transcriptional regulator with XRE-family HTH domain
MNQYMNPESYLIYLGRAIAAMRAERGLARKDLAAASGVSYPYLSELENGIKNASMPMVVAIATALGVSPSAILLRAENIADKYPISEGE